MISVMHLNQPPGVDSRTIASVVAVMLLCFKTYAATSQTRVTRAPCNHRCLPHGAVGASKPYSRRDSTFCTRIIPLSCIHRGRAFASLQRLISTDEYYELRKSSRNHRELLTRLMQSEPRERARARASSPACDVQKPTMPCVAHR